MTNSEKLLKIAASVSTTLQFEDEWSCTPEAKCKLQLMWGEVMEVISVTDTKLLLMEDNDLFIKLVHGTTGVPHIIEKYIGSISFLENKDNRVTILEV